ncbi:high mobility group B protein 14 isoform X2 [Hevea brasiliensis]|uniref:high mobility group B protein 14 isoform X2 n=1 Tax=Hevea brasiliensis TaxID=3981 RepID=UPI0025DB4060|nr:high mobility group B protein 14 isoform X2 [Hevea brasiliensis]
MAKKTPKSKKRRSCSASSASSNAIRKISEGEDFRKDFQEQNPDVKSMRDIGKACGEKWKTMTYEDKVKYYDIAMEKRAEFDKAMADYIKKRENGENEEIEDDSEFDE